MELDNLSGSQQHLVIPHCCKTGCGIKSPLFGGDFGSIHFPSRRLLSHFLMTLACVPSPTRAQTGDSRALCSLFLSPGAAELTSKLVCGLAERWPPGSWSHHGGRSRSLAALRAGCGHRVDAGGQLPHAPSPGRQEQAAG